MMHLPEQWPCYVRTYAELVMTKKILDEYWTCFSSDEHYFSSDENKPHTTIHVEHLIQWFTNQKRIQYRHSSIVQLVRLDLLVILDFSNVITHTVLIDESRCTEWQREMQLMYSERESTALRPVADLPHQLLTRSRPNRPRPHISTLIPLSWCG
jgi:hypothetical protein